jgi:uncharacterized membrane protein YqjE
MYPFSTPASTACSEKRHIAARMQLNASPIGLAQDAQTISTSEPMAEREATTNIERRDARDLPSLLERLAADLSTLFDQKLALLKIEVKEEANAYLRGTVLILAGAIVAAIGFSLTNIALAFGISTLFANANLSQSAKYGLGFLVTGAAYLVIGTAVILITRKRLAGIGLVPRRTVNELERDKAWLQKEL